MLRDWPERVEGFVLRLTVAPADTIDLPVRVAVPRPNLQFMSFWTAVGARHFAHEDLAVTALVPETPAGAVMALLSGRTEAAVLSPPMYLHLLANDQPVVLCANLLRNDPLNLVVTRAAAATRRLTPDLPLAERVQGLRGLRLAVSPGPVDRLRTLLEAGCLEGGRDVEIVSLRTTDHDQAFAQGAVDAVYTHSPHLERAIVDQHGLLLVHASGGEVKASAVRQIHCLAVSASFANREPAAVDGLVRAIGRAQRLLHDDRAAAVDALLQSGIHGLRPPLLERIVDIYEPAIPDWPHVTEDSVQEAAAFQPAGPLASDVSSVDLARHIWKADRQA
jgi:ABC-type nitrate/sulfonate/bicarbonate transport system substrate-binding protein